MNRGDHIPLLSDDGFRWRLTCACGDYWENGSQYIDTFTNSDPHPTRIVRTVAQARKAHQCHCLSPAADPTCEHIFEQLDSGHVICTRCAEPLGELA